MAASVTQRHTVVLGPIKMEYILVDANDATELANVETRLANPFACDVFEISHTDGTTNDTQLKNADPLAAFSGAAPPTSKLIDLTSLTIDAHFVVWVMGF